MNRKGQNMKRFIKIFTVAALAASVAAVTTPKAEAFGGWAVGGAAVGGLAVGTVIGATVVAHTAPSAYYAYPGTAIAPPVCAPAPTVVVGPPVCAAPVFVARAYPYYYRPFVRVGFGWGRGYHYRRWR